MCGGVGGLGWNTPPRLTEFDFSDVGVGVFNTRKPVTKLWLSAKRMKVSWFYSTLVGAVNWLPFAALRLIACFRTLMHTFGLAKGTLLKTGGLYRKKVVIQWPTKKVSAFRYYRSTKTSLSFTITQL